MKNSDLSNITQKRIGILIPFSDNYAAKLSASELARKTKQPQQSVSRCLNKLAKQNLLNYSKEGRNKLFYLDLSKQASKIILNLIENSKALQFQLKGKEIAITLSEIQQNCESLILFGSYASETANKESDIDIAILGKSNSEEIKKIIDRKTVEINAYYFIYSEFEKLLDKKEPLAIEILHNHILFGGVSRNVELFWKWYCERI